jgi:uncharacterized membrane protein
MAILISILIFIFGILIIVFGPYLLGFIFYCILDMIDYSDYVETWFTGLGIIFTLGVIALIGFGVINFGILPLVHSWGIK